MGRLDKIKWGGGALLALLAIGWMFVSAQMRKPRVSGVQINVATLCDSAADRDGKLTIEGTFDAVYAERFPALKSACSLALRLSFAKDQFKRHSITIRFLDPDGDPLIDDIKSHMEPKAYNSGASTALNLIVNFAEMRLSQPGVHMVEVWLDDRLLAKLPLDVALRK